MGQNVDLLRKGLALNDARDHAGFRATMAPDVEVVAPQGTFRGRDEVMAFFKQEWTAFTRGETAIVTALESEDWVSAECRITAVNDGPLTTPMGEIPATGRAIDLTYALWARQEAGLLKSLRLYFDSMAYAGQLGLIPEPAGS